MNNYIQYSIHNLSISAHVDNNCSSASVKQIATSLVPFAITIVTYLFRLPLLEPERPRGPPEGVLDSARLPVSAPDPAGSPSREPLSGELSLGSPLWEALSGELSLGSLSGEPPHVPLQLLCSTLAAKQYSRHSLPYTYIYIYIYTYSIYTYI